MILYTINPCRNIDIQKWKGEPIFTYRRLPIFALQNGASPTHPTNLEEMGIDTKNPLNYEPYYLNALMMTHNKSVEDAAFRFYEWYGPNLSFLDDPYNLMPSDVLD